MAPAITVILRRILTAGLFAGFIAGTAATVVQMLQVTPLILAAEVFEEAAAGPAHVHEGSTAGEHHHGASEAWAPGNGLERNAFTWLANILTGVGFGLILAAVMAVAGRPVDARRGLLWGLAGYGAFAVAPALGLPPELPGMMAADLAARQVWWIMTVGATAAGLALIVFAPGKPYKPYKRLLQTAGLALILLPHLLGAPHLATEAGTVPAELAARFAVASLAAAALFWAVLGVVVGHLMARLLPATAAHGGSPQPA